MKRVLCVTIILALVFSIFLCACGQKTHSISGAYNITSIKLNGFTFGPSSDTFDATTQFYVDRSGSNIGFVFTMVLAGDMDILSGFMEKKSSVNGTITYTCYVYSQPAMSNLSSVDHFLVYYDETSDTIELPEGNGITLYFAKR